MTSIGDFLDKMVITVTSPDNRIRARVHDYVKAEVGFRPGAYEKYDEERLGHQLARLAATTWVAYSRGRSEAYRLSRNLGESELAAAEQSISTPKEREYEVKLAVIEAEGVSPGRNLRIRSRGLIQWHFDIKPGTLARLPETGFLAELHAAYELWQNDRQAKIIVLKSDYFDMGIPRAGLDMMAELRALNARKR